MSANKFLSGEWDTNQWFVSSSSTDDNCIISMNQFDYVVDSQDTIEELPRSENTQHIKSAIRVAIYTKLKRFELSVAPEATSLNLKGLEDDTMEFFITKRNDPSHVLTIITTTAKELFEQGTLIFDFPVDGNDFSVLTKKLFRFYQLTVKRNKMTNRSQHAHHRVNTLVSYKQIKTLAEGRDGIIVIHNVNTGLLEISLDGEVHDITTEMNSTGVTIFLTHPRDPTILIDTVKFDLRDIDFNKTLTLPVAREAGLQFGIAGFPYVDKLSFLRK